MKAIGGSEGEGSLLIVCKFLCCACVYVCVYVFVCSLAYA